MLAYYVERYDVELDAAFEAHLERRGWRPPAAVDVTSVMLPWEADEPA